MIEHLETAVVRKPFDHAATEFRRGVRAHRLRLGFYATQKTGMETLAARSLQVDLSFAQYRPEAEPLRSALRSTLGGTTHNWGDGTRTTAIQGHAVLQTYVA